ncbi:hypothetical protein [Sphingobacterium paramultivorum]|uniref:hypothetical protein n=1 Tax=Sphingobacterium paramultivorum TaxID=2886510 RepID=UPI00129CA239|nr:hypothetical protein [Sphingobacterium paramultivorum]
MKNLRITLGIAALAIGSFAAFSFAPASSEAKVALQEFYMNPDGTPGEAVGEENECPNQGTPICSAEYDTVANSWTGNKIHRGVRP